MKPESVDEYMRKLEHPLKRELEAVRRIILGAHPAIGEAVKWNAPSFYVKEYFATAGVRSKDFVHLVFHMGAKVKDDTTKGVKIADPKGLLAWHAKERCSAKFHDMQEIEKNKSALQSIVKQWIKQM